MADTDIPARVKKATVVYISDAPDETVRNMHMLPAHSVDEALHIAEGILLNENAGITVIPDGVAVMVTE